MANSTTWQIYKNYHNIATKRKRQRKNKHKFSRSNEADQLKIIYKKKANKIIAKEICIRIHTSVPPKTVMPLKPFKNQLFLQIRYFHSRPSFGETSAVPARDAGDVSLGPFRTCSLIDESPKMDRIRITITTRSRITTERRTRVSTRDPRSVSSPHCVRRHRERQSAAMLIIVRGTAPNSLSDWPTWSRDQRAAVGVIGFPRCTLHTVAAYSLSRRCHAHAHHCTYTHTRANFILSYKRVSLGQTQTERSPTYTLL